MEKTLVLIKPDGVYRALIGEVIKKFELAGLKIVALKMVKPSRDLVEKHYHADKEWLENIGKKTKISYEKEGKTLNETPLEIGTRVQKNLITYLTGKPVVAMVVEGNEAIFIVRKIIGSTEPKSADPGSIRGMFSSDSYFLSDSQGRSTRNIVHASGDKKDSEREISIWFSNSEIIDYKRADEDAMFSEM
ncbi:MAG: nucleoside-diphosphate kinase [Candidatus Micrarchaeia archaeon]